MARESLPTPSDGLPVRTIDGEPLTARERALQAVWEVEVERLRTLVEPKEWMGWDEVQSIYDEARLLRRERDEARAEVERLREALSKIAEGDYPSPDTAWRVAQRALNGEARS